ncbi:hypothetical protein ACFFYR_06150 [Paraburkholderia dipogonis]|uniref:hypothetical protein n=1 Tax=Paraburkholderia dipogonis TaxID=1211383 RepID=UPI0035EE2CD7
MEDYGERDKSRRKYALCLSLERIISFEDNDHFWFFHNLMCDAGKGKIRNQGYNAVIAAYY